MRLVKDIAMFLRGRLQQTTGAAVPANAPVSILALGAPATVAPNDATTKNTAIKYSIGDYIGTVFYDRVDATTWWTKNVPSTIASKKLVIRSTQLTCIYDILKDINDYTRLQLTEAEVVNTPIADGVVSSVTLTFTDNAIWFTGSLTLALHRPVYVSGGLVTKFADYTAKQLTALAGQDKTTARYNPGLLTYSNDYSASTAALLAIDAMPRFSWLNGTDLVSAANAATIATALKAVDGLPWTYNTSARVPFNLYNTVVAYNGPVEDYINQFGLPSVTNSYDIGYGMLLNKLKLPRTDKQFIMVLLPSAPASVATLGSTNFTFEPIFIHYGNDVLPVVADRPPVHHWTLDDDRHDYGTSATKPDFLVAGKFLSVAETAVRGLVPDYYDGSNFSSGGYYYLGAELPIDKDFSICFEICDYEGGIDAARTSAPFFQLCTDQNAGSLRLNADAGSNATHLPVIIGTSTLSGTRLAPTGVWFPQWASIVFTRRGDWWYVYINGQITVMFKGTVAQTIVNTLWLRTSYGNCIRNFKYFDYGLSGDQVRRQQEAIFNTPDAAKVPALPTPLHRWPLNGDRVNKGTSTTPLADIFNFRACGGTKPGQWAYRKYSDGVSHALGVSLPIDRDFALSFDFFTSDPNSSLYTPFLMGTYTDNTGHLLNFAGTLPYIGDSWILPKSIIYHRQIPTMGMHRITVCRDNGLFKYYVNGILLYATKASNTAISAWTHFGYVAGAYLNANFSFRNLTYYDRALTHDEVMLDVTKDWS